MSFLASHEEQEILLGVRNLSSNLKVLAEQQESCCRKFERRFDELDKKLNLLLQRSAPPPAVGFTATVTITSTQGELTMGKALKVAGDLQVADNGTFEVTLRFVDSIGEPAAVPAGLSAVYTASDATPGPSALTLVPSEDTSSAAGSVNQANLQALPPGTALPSGLTVSITATWTGLASPLTAVAAPPIDVIAGPANSFVATESTP